MKERNIFEKQTKKGLQLQVRISKNGKRKVVGSFLVSDFPTKKDAYRAAVKCREKAEMQERLPDRMTVDDCFESCVDLLIDNASTEKRYRKIYLNLVDENLRNKDIETLKLADIQKSINNYADNKSQGDISLSKTIWKKILQAARQNDLNVTIFIDDVKLPRSKRPVKKQNREITHAELFEFLHNLDNYADNEKTAKRCKDLKFIITIMAYLGLRPREALGLMKEDIDFDNNVIHIRHSIGATKTKRTQIVTVKTEAGNRDIPIPDELRPALEVLPDGLIFKDVDGEPYEIDKLSSLMNNINRRFGTHVVLYSLRKLFATDMYNSEDAKTVQKIMGHKDSTMTFHYVNADEEKEKEIMEKRKLS